MSLSLAVPLSNVGMPSGCARGHIRHCVCVCVCVGMARVIVYYFLVLLSRDTTRQVFHACEIRNKILHELDLKLHSNIW